MPPPQVAPAAGSAGCTCTRAHLAALNGSVQTQRGLCFSALGSRLQVRSKLQAFISDMRLDAGLSRRMQEALQLRFHLHGGVSLPQLLATPEVSRNIREDVLMYAYSHRLQVRHERR
jgi:hypothetical protein